MVDEACSLDDVRSKLGLSIAESVLYAQHLVQNGAARLVVPIGMDSTYMINPDID